MRRPPIDAVLIWSLTALLWTSLLLNFVLLHRAHT